jgi:hypothetical protein
MDDLGPPIAHLALKDGTPVYDRDGERIGVVDRVVTPGDAAIFDGVLIHTLPLPGHHVFADHTQVAELHERGVVLAVGREELHPLDERSRREDHPADGPLRARIRRAWDRLTGLHA